MLMYALLVNRKSFIFSKAIILENLIKYYMPIFICKKVIFGKKTLLNKIACRCEEKSGVSSSNSRTKSSVKQSFLVRAALP